MKADRGPWKAALVMRLKELGPILLQPNVAQRLPSVPRFVTLQLRAQVFPLLIVLVRATVPWHDYVLSMVKEESHCGLNRKLLT